ncbi:DUF4132 domain-containing protein [Deinococcus roseus]|uniref:DUF4132 domain-containing protein n=1 Tax=Deinococcus roseus TaxID=392414 RepID=A0ABQ2DEM8_9DEIO|nr:DUF4132 domain-containing protein [Deinococcus roseus]GGJ51796.1 hypothetical protein GCM10008938_42320 [Deinococcus roseus]
MNRSEVIAVRIEKIFFNNSPAQTPEAKKTVALLQNFVSSETFQPDLFQHLLQFSLPQMSLRTSEQHKWLSRALESLATHQQSFPAPQVARIYLLKWSSDAQGQANPSPFMALRKLVELDESRSIALSDLLNESLPHFPEPLQAFGAELKEGAAQLNAIAESSASTNPTEQAQMWIQKLSTYEKWTFNSGFIYRGQSLLQHVQQQTRQVREQVMMMLLDTNQELVVSLKALHLLLQQEKPLNSQVTLAVLEWAGKRHSLWFNDPLFALIKALCKASWENKTLPETTKAMLRRTAAMYPDYAATREVLNWLNDALPNAGEIWADQALSDLQTLPASETAAWRKIFEYSLEFSGSKPNAKLLKNLQACVNTLSDPLLNILSWLEKATQGRSFALLTDQHSSMNQAEDGFNSSLLRGIIWLTPGVSHPQLPRLLAQLTEYSLKKLPGVGPRNPKIANACIYALGQLDTSAALAQLARLKTRVTFKSTLKEIEKALDAKASKLGISKEDLEELGIPTYGLDVQGERMEQLGDLTAKVQVKGREVEISYQNAAGKVLKSPSAQAKQDFAEELKELKALSKDIPQMLTAVSDRLDGLYLKQKSWSFEVWQERYLQHPLVHLVARNLIWKFEHAGQVQSLMWQQDRFVGATGQVCSVPEDARVALWHPLDSDTKEVLLWRDFVLQQGITQPFKQAFREIYLLTAAEENTRVYSNRFAAHILKQHQFNALCGLRGWKNDLRLMVDDSYNPPLKKLPEWNLRAEFWVEGAGDEYGIDTNESGTFLYLATDQVRFYALNASENWAHAGGGGYTSGSYLHPMTAEPIPLSEIPALVFSETMRDVDLFVGVCSVGNDPNWTDQGAQQRHYTYWQGYSFGELSETAQTRKVLLEKLVPRLKIRNQATLEGRFLRVQGKLRAYKIHLGSGNILMEPDDQYLCIVPGSSVKEQVLLPFDGDRTLAIILSKAFMLAQDNKISDPTITRQIRR